MSSEHEGVGDRGGAINVLVKESSLRSHIQGQREAKAVPGTSPTVLRADWVVDVTAESSCFQGKEEDTQVCPASLQPCPWVLPLSGLSVFSG